ncbi:MULTISPECIES: hypothetical protein [Paraburkholderia]|uniref:hypothetical protein n=1 Tax=Paraburkholderia TaxID=1822464 RepID=UPI0027E1F2F7|nr:hypothetical protein [Paraburkholderia madseniana]
MLLILPPTVALSTQKTAADCCGPSLTAFLSSYLLGFLNSVLDSVPMSYWRKLFLVVLLALSLPVQSFAAVSMKCESSHVGGEGVSMLHENAGEATHQHDHAAMMADSANDIAGAHSQNDSHPGGAHHAHACSTCASCCFGGGLPVAPVAAISADAVHFAVPLAPSVRVASFLTDGIERPPRISLV